MKSNILDLFYSGFWAITEEKLSLIHSIAARESLPEEIKALRMTLKENAIAENEKNIENSNELTEKELETIVIPVNGVIVPKGNMFSNVSGSLSLDVLKKQIQSAIQSEQIKNIILSFHSPGGEATGISEFANFLRNSTKRSRKNIYAYAYGDCCSAAYWIASAVKIGNFVASSTARIGSIGVISNIVDTRERDEKEGVRQLVIRSNLSPNKNPDVFTEEGYSQYQKNIDSLAEIFVKDIARNRGVSRKTVLSDYGQGKIFIGQEAVDNGMVDRIGSLDSILEELSRNE